VYLDIYIHLQEFLKVYNETKENYNDMDEYNKKEMKKLYNTLYVCV
jgi:hypothetical protein